MRVHCPKVRNIVHTISLLMFFFLLLPKDQTIILYFTEGQISQLSSPLVCCDFTYVTRVSGAFPSKKQCGPSTQHNFSVGKCSLNDSNSLK